MNTHFARGLKNFHITTYMQVPCVDAIHAPAQSQMAFESGLERRIPDEPKNRQKPHTSCKKQ